MDCMILFSFTLLCTFLLINLFNVLANLFSLNRSSVYLFYNLFALSVFYNLFIVFVCENCRIMNDNF